MFVGLSFGATVRGGAFVGAFAGAFLFGAMAAARVFRVGAAGGRNEQRRGRGFGGEDV
jgi:hypothetical protein